MTEKLLFAISVSARPSLTFLSLYLSDFSNISPCVAVYLSGFFSPSSQPSPPLRHLSRPSLPLWSSNLGKKVATYHAVGPINWLKWLHEGPFLAFSNGSLNYHVNILNLKTRARLFSTAHKGLLSPDEKYFATIYEHTSIQIQEIETGALFYTYRDHESRVLTFAWSPDSRSLASSDLAHTIHVWQIQARIFENG